MDRETELWMERQADKETDRHTERHRQKYNTVAVRRQTSIE